MHHIKVIKDGNVNKVVKEQLVDGVQYVDDEPREGSLNGITSGAVAKVAGDVGDVKDLIPEGTSEENPLVNETGLGEVAERVTTAEGDIDSIEGKIPSGASSSNKLVTESDLEAAKDSWQTGFTPKGEATVSAINALTTQSNGDQYIVTDSGTITAGTLAVTAGDTVAWDSTNEVWYKVNQYAKASDVAALTTYAPNVAHSIAPEFDPTRTSENPYKAGETVMYTDGKAYTFKVDHYGAWSSADVEISNSAQKISELAEHIKLSVPLASCESGKYIKADGSTVNDANYAATGFIPVAGSILRCYASLGSYTLAAFYDENFNFISNYNGDATATSKTKVWDVQIPDGAVYFRFSILLDAFNSRDVTVESFTLSDKYLKMLEKCNLISEKSFTLDSTTLSLDKYVAGNSGLIGNRTDYAASDYIDISDLMPGFPVLSYASMLQYTGVAFYSASKTYISGWYGNNISSLGSGLTGNKWRVLPVPTDAIYVRVSVPKTFTTSVVLKYVSSPNVRAASNAVSALKLIDNPLEDMIANAVCIGDSLTIGADYTSGNYTGNMATNYPYFLGKMTGMNVAPSNTAAFAGDTAVDCYGRFFSGAGAIDVTAYDAFFIWLGTNGGYTDTLQEDVLDHGTDYASYANTSTGCLCKIISTIIASNPTAKIFLGNVFTTSGDKSITNSVIQQVAALAMYEDNIVGVVNNDDGSLYNSHPEYHPGNVLHFGKVGNYFLAKHWRDEIRRLINLNVTLMEYPRAT